MKKTCPTLSAKLDALSSRSMYVHEWTWSIIPPFIGVDISKTELGNFITPEKPILGNKKKSSFDSYYDYNHWNYDEILMVIGSTSGNEANEES